MKGRKVHTDADLNKLMDEITENWDRTTDTNQLLTALEGEYFSGDSTKLPLLTARNIYSTNKTSELTEINLAAMKKCLNLIKKLACNEKTDVKRLISLITEKSKITKEQPSSCLGMYADKYNNTEFIAEYLNILLILTTRNDVSTDEMKLLLSHHDERGQESYNRINGSLVFDLAEIARKGHKKRPLLQNYLAHLAMLADEGKIDADTIYAALLAPKGAEKNIGKLIAKYPDPDCYMLLAKLLRHLRNAGFHIKKFLPSIGDFPKYSKETFLDVLRSLQDNEKLTEGLLFADPEDPVGKLMNDARGFNNCDREHGTLNEVCSIYGNAAFTISLEQQKESAESRIKAVTNPVKQPTPSAPPMGEKEGSESDALFAKIPPEYAVPRIVADPQNKDILGTQLRLAAGYKKNDEIRKLVDLGADVNYHRDIGDICSDASPLYLAAEQNNLDGARLLLDAQADVNCQRHNRMTALCIAATHQNNDIAMLLLQHGAEVDIITREINSPLSLARCCSDEVMSAMVDKLCGKYQNNPRGLLKFLQQDNHYRRCVEKASSGNKLLSLLKLKDFLISNGIRKDNVNALLPSAFSFKLENIKAEFIKALKTQPHAVQREISNRIVNDADSWEYKFARMKRGTTLEPACRSGHGMLGEAERIDLYYRHLHEQLISAITALSKTAGSNQSPDKKAEIISKIQKFIEQGADINSTHHQLHWKGATPLATAASFGNINVIDILLEHGADPAQTVTIQRKIFMQDISYINKAKRELIKKFINDNKSEEFTFLPEELAKMFGENEAAEFLKSKRLAKDKIAEAKHDAAIGPVFVPPVIAPPPSYQDALKTQNIYPSVPAVNEKVEAEMADIIVKSSQARTSEPVAAVQPGIVQVKAEMTIEVEVTTSIPAPIAEVQRYNPFDEAVDINTAVVKPSFDLFAELLAPNKSAIDLAFEFNEIQNSLPAPMQPTSTTLILQHISTELSALPTGEPVASNYRNPFDELIDQPSAPSGAPVKQSFNPFAVSSDVNMASPEKMMDDSEKAGEADRFKIFGKPSTNIEKEPASDSKKDNKNARKTQTRKMEAPPKEVKVTKKTEQKKQAQFGW